MNKYNLQVLPSIDFYFDLTQEMFLGEWRWERVGKERNQDVILNLSPLFFESIYAGEPVYKQNHLALASIISTSELFNRIPKPKNDDILTCFHLDVETRDAVEYCFQYIDGRWVPSSLANYTRFYHVTRKIASGFFCVKN